MKLNHTFILLFLLITPTAFAISEHDLAICATKGDSGERLACYDALAESILGESTAQRDATSNSWVLTRGSLVGSGRNGNDNDLELSLLSETEIQVDEDNVRPVLSVSCQANKVAVKLNWKINLGRDSIRMRTRFDDRSHRSSTWVIGSDFQTVRLRSSDISFIKRMMRHDKLTVEITPFGTRPVSAEFNIQGLDKSIAPLTEVCKF